MCDTEVYTVRVDSQYSASDSHSNFVAYMNVPLRNVIKAELLSASVYTGTPPGPPVIYIYVDELVSKLSDRTDLQYSIRTAGTISTEGTAPGSTISNTAALATCIASIPSDQAYNRTIFSTGSNFPVETYFIEPIRQIDKLTIRIFKETGTLLSGTGENATFMTFRFTCSKPNRCVYPDRGGAPLM